MYINSSVPGNPLSNTYTAVFVVNAERNTMPLNDASGYASGNQAENGGAATLTRNPISINQVLKLSGCMAVNRILPVSLV